jgi:hypothetical protein
MKHAEKTALHERLSASDAASDVTAQSAVPITAVIDGVNEWPAIKIPTNV